MIRLLGRRGQMITIAFKGSDFERHVMLWGVRWYVTYPVSHCQIEEMMGEQGVEVDHATLHRWVMNYVPALEQAFLARKRPVGGSWRLDETHVRGKGTWKYLYRAVDKAGATVDFLLMAKRWVQRFLPAFERCCNRYVRMTGRSWRVDETYAKFRDQGILLQRAEDAGLRPIG
jgi:transposase-like protein